MSYNIHIKLINRDIHAAAEISLSETASVVPTTIKKREKRIKNIMSEFNDSKNR